MQYPGETEREGQYNLALPTLQKLNATVPDSLDAKLFATTWFAQFSRGLEAGDVPTILSLLLGDAFWRDMLALTWEFRTFNGSDRIFKFLVDILKPPLEGTCVISSLSLDTNQVKLQTPYPDLAWIQGVFSFETPVGLGTGVFRLVPTSSGEWKAHVVYTNLEALKGYPEKIGELRNMDQVHGDEWQERRYRESNFIDSEPAVVVIGGGQAGLEIAARLKYLDVPTLVVERHSRIGDTWRTRYDALCLHNPNCESLILRYTFPAYINVRCVVDCLHLPYVPCVY